jgi:hypothetical protein
MPDIDPLMTSTSINGSILCCRNSLFHIRTAVSYTSISASYYLTTVSLVDMPLPASVLPFSWWRPELYIKALCAFILFLLISFFPTLKPTRISNLDTNSHDEDSLYLLSGRCCWCSKHPPESRLPWRQLQSCCNRHRQRLFPRCCKE